MGKDADLPKWEALQFCEKSGDREPWSFPFEEELASSGAIHVPSLTKIALLTNIGWPDARTAMKDTHGRPLIVKKDDIVWLLKIKPSCWRLYFYVDQTKKRVVFLYAVCKKHDKEDKQDAKTARSRYDKITSGSRGGIARFPIPN